MVRITAIALWAAFLTLASVRVAVAHPLGNFTINHLAAVDARDGRLRVHYVLDIAEIPTFAIMHGAGSWTPAAMAAWRDGEAAMVAQNFLVRVDGAAVALQTQRTGARTRPGAGGLPILYWTGDFTAPLPRSGSVSIQDLVYADRRIGWKDIVLAGMTDPTDALRSYPSALLGSPRHNDVASFDYTPDGRIAHVRVSGDPGVSWAAGSLVRSSFLSDLFARSGQTPALIALTVLVAFGLGALHGLEPGHGKALLAFTLVGARATFKQAAVLAAALTFAHTIAVLLLGLLLLFAAGFATESLFSWITLISGLAVVTIGARTLRGALAHARAHATDTAHDHGHQHGHEGHAHSHALPGAAPLRFGSAVVAAMSGGIAPCPAAIVVLLTAVHLHRIGYGLVLIVIFSLGLAAILAGLGMAVVHGAAWLGRRGAFARVAAAAPFVTAVVISVVGASMLAQGALAVGARASVSALFAATLAGVVAIAALPVLIPLRSTHRTLAVKETS